MKVKLRGGKLTYEVISFSEGQVTLVDPHTGHSFVLPDAVETLATAGYVRVKPEHKKRKKND